MYFLTKIATWSHGRGNEGSAIPLLDDWTCSPSRKNSSRAIVVETRRPNHSFPSRGIAVTSDITVSETSTRSPHTSEWVSRRFKANCKASSRLNPSSRSKYLVHPAAWKMAKTSGLVLSSYVFKGSWRAGSPMVVAAELQSPKMEIAKQRMHRSLRKDVEKRMVNLESSV